MIKSFRNKDTENLFSGRCPRKLRAIRSQAERKLMLVHAATTVEFLKTPPGNRLEKLSGDRRDAWSIRINDKWRICFRFENGHAYDVEIVDYH